MPPCTAPGREPGSVVWPGGKQNKQENGAGEINASSGGEDFGSVVDLSHSCSHFFFFFKGPTVKITTEKKRSGRKHRRQTGGVSYLPTRSSKRHLGPCFEIPFKAEHVYRLSHLERDPARSGHRRQRRAEGLPRPRGAASPRLATRGRRAPRRSPPSLPRPAAFAPPVAPLLTGGRGCA